MNINKHIDSKIQSAKINIINISKKHPNLSIDLANWISEMTYKISLIKSNPKKETENRKRGNVYWIDFGVNIGSEFNNPHFCVVIKEFEHTVIGVPLSSKKDITQDWKNPKNMIIDIGFVKGLEDEKEAYAMVNQIRSLSKQRLTPYRDANKNFVNLKLNNEQLDLIDESLKGLLGN